MAKSPFTTKMRISEEDMMLISKELKKRHPYLYRDNIAYEAKLICFYEIKVNEHFVEEIKEIISK